MSIKHGRLRLGRFMGTPNLWEAGGSGGAFVSSTQGRSNKHPQRLSLCSSIKNATVFGYRGPLHTRDWEPVTNHSSTCVGGNGGAGPSSLHTPLEGPTEYISECKMDVKHSYMDYYMASNTSCFMVTWTIFKNRLLEIGLLPQNWGGHDIPNAHNCWYILFCHVWGLAWIDIHWDSIWLKG